MSGEERAHLETLIELRQQAASRREEAPRIARCYSDELHTLAAAFGIRTETNVERLARTLHTLITEIAEARDAANEDHARRRGLT